ncbi:hypothetical protein A5873_002610, partial [Enterococcus faecium]
WDIIINVLLEYVNNLSKIRISVLESRALVASSNNKTLLSDNKTLARAILCF